ncbi:cupredoxin-like protein [Tumebacillus sp. BK434]|uniref:cupredoxin domain-containing protein n=1 Tax=Tumebacillus sp. BK434 TaxID=2512169 RepID=UPI00104BF165|nr:cupredoxin domain-containing protein [Tumebacillus sp. BK434]TCP55690.1 cupredoxin-like protein [Tumebacillus sp. BK434]
MKKMMIGAAMLAALLTGQADVVAAETQPYLDSSHVTDTGVQQKQEFWIVTNEIKTKLADGKEIEAYRWDPGFLTVEKGKPVTLHFYGLKGKAHPFVIEGLGVKGNVEKGKVSSVTFTPEQEGTYRVVCLTHATIEANGPMVGYLRVE